MKTKLLLSVLLTLATTGTWAQETTIDGIHYTINDDGQTASVVGADEGITTANILENVNIDDKNYPVTFIREYSLMCSTLKHVYIPKTITWIDDEAINNNIIIETIVVDPDNPVYDSRDNCNAIIETQRNRTVIVRPCSSLPSSIKIIGECSFIGASFETLTIPEGIECIEFYSFDRATINTLYIPASCVDIQGGAFVYSNISNIVVDSNNPKYYIEDLCLIERGTGMLVDVYALSKTVNIPESVISLGQLSLSSFNHSHADFFYNCEFPVKAENADGYVQLGYGGGNIGILHVPEGSIPRYLYQGWNHYREGFEAITDGTFTCYCSVEGDYHGVPYIEPLYLTADKAGEEITLSVVLNGPGNATAFQFDIYLPEGMEVTFDDDGYEDILLSTQRTNERKHTFETQQMQDGAWRVLCYSNNNYTFEGNEGEVCTINVRTSANMANNGLPIVFKNLTTTLVNEEGGTEQVQRDQLTTYVNFFTPEYPEMGDANNDGQVNVTDITTLVSYIMGNQPTKFVFGLADIHTDGQINVTDIAATVNVILNGSAPQQAPRRRAPRRTEGQQATTAQLEVIPFAIAPGEEKEVEVVLNNPDDDFTGFQFDLTLPEGISLVSDEIGYVVDLGSRTTTRKHTIQASLQADGSIRVMAYSSRNSNFSGTEGDVAILTLKADDQLTAGVYNLQLNNIVLSQADGSDISQVEPADYEGSILSGILAENPVIKGDITAEAATIISGAVAASVNSIDLTQAVAVAEDASFSPANPNTLIFAPAATANVNQNVIAGDVCTNLILSETGTFATPKSFSATLSMTRTVKGGYNTVCLPFDLTADQVAATFGVATKVYTFEDVADGSNSVINFNTKADNTITANVPVLISDATASTELDFSDVVVKNGEAVVAGTNFDFVGTYAASTDVAAGDYFVGNGALYKSTGNTTIKAFRAYIKTKTPDAGIKMFIDGIATGIHEIEGAGADDEIIYNLAGMRVNKVQKGIFIVNGKKYIVK